MPEALLAHDAHAAKRERRKQARPGELIDAALALFVSKGFAATRVEEVAQRAGVSKGTLFLYFSSKEELFKAVVRHNLSGRFLEWDAEIDSFEGSSADLVRTCLESWWERIGNTPASGISKLIMSEAANFPEIAAFYEQEVIRPGTALIRRIIDRGVARGEFRAVNVEYAVYSLLAAMMFLVMWKHSLAPCMHSHQSLVPQHYLAHISDVVLHGLCAASTPAPASTAHLCSTRPTGAKSA